MRLNYNPHPNRYCFQKVLEEGKRVHMVYQGHLLRPDSAPLSEFTLDNPSTFICQISHSANSSSSNLNNSAAGSANEEELDISGPCTTGCLICVLNNIILAVLE